MKIIRLAITQWEMQLKKIDFWMVIFSLGLFYWSNFAVAKDNLLVSNTNMGIFSVFPVVMREESTLFLSLICFMILASDLPLTYQGVEYLIMKMNRKQWFFSQIITAVLYVITFLIIIDIIQILCYVPCITVSNSWGSGVLKGIVFGGTNASISTYLLNVKPAMAFLSAMALYFFYLTMTAFIFMGSNMVGVRDNIPLLVNAVLIAIYIICKRNYWDLGFLSPVSLLRSYANSTWVSVPMACIFYVMVSVVILGLTGKKLKTMDIKTTVMKC